MLKSLFARWLMPPLAGALALTVWGMLFWGVLYEPLRVFDDLTPGVEQAAAALETADTQTGTYFMPWPRNTPEAMTAWLGKHRTGPFFKLSYIREGADPQSVPKLMRGVGLYVVVAAIAMGLLHLSAHSPERWLRGSLVVFLAGIMGSVLIQIGDPVWFHLPWPHALGNLVFQLGAWLLLGLAVALAMRATDSG